MNDDTYVCTPDGYARVMATTLLHVGEAAEAAREHADALCRSGFLAFAKPSRQLEARQFDGPMTGTVLRQVRALRNLTQAQLAAQAGVSATAIAEFEKDKRELRSNTIRKLCDALGVKVTYRL